MADLSPVNQDWGNIVANIPFTGPRIAQMGAQTNVLGQQAQGLNIANQRAAIGLALYKHVLGDFQSQGFGSAPSADQSGENPPGASSSGPVSASQPDSSDASGESAPSGSGTKPPVSTLALSGAPTESSVSSGPTAAPAAAPGASAAPNQTAGSSEDTVDSGLPDDLGLAPELRSEFFVNPAGNRRSQQMLLEAAFSGDPGLLQYAKQQRDLQVQSDTALSQKKAQDLYDMMGTVARAPKGAALAMLGRIAPPLADKIEAQYANDPAEADAVARAAAMHIAGTVHQYTDRALVLGPDGVYRDKVTGMAVPVPVAGMSPKAYAELSAKGEVLVSVPQSDGTSKQMPLWQADKAPNLAAWTAQQAARGQALSGIQNSPLGRVPGLPAGLHPAIAAAAMNHPSLNQAPGAAPSPNGPPSQPPALTPAQAQYNQQLRSALADKEYRLQQPTVVSGQTATPAVLAQQKETVKSRAQLMQDSQSATQAAANSLMYLRAAQLVLASPNKPPTGLSAPLQAAVSRAWQAVHSAGGTWATQYQQLAKYLSNAALQNARSTYGARMTQSEVKLQLENMNPSAHMTPAAINALIAENMRNATYTLQSARRVRAYLMAGNDPQSFAEWNQQYFPQQKIVNQQAPATTNASGSVPRPAPGPAPAAALAALKANPGLAAQFKAYYGYLPSPSPGGSSGSW